MTRDELDFNDGMVAKLDGDYLRWNHKDQWIYVADLPTKIIDELKQYPAYASTAILEAYLNDNSDTTVNDCAV